MKKEREREKNEKKIEKSRENGGRWQDKVKRKRGETRRGELASARADQDEAFV